MGILDDHYQHTFPLHEAWKERCRQTGTEVGAVHFDHNAKLPTHKTREDIAALGLLTLTHTSVTDFPAKRNEGRYAVARPHSPEQALTELARGVAFSPAGDEATPPPSKSRRTRSPPQSAASAQAPRKRRPSPPATQAKGSEGASGRGCRARPPTALADTSLMSEDQPPKAATPRAGGKRRASVTSREDEEEWGPSPRSGSVKAKKRAKVAGWTAAEIEKGSKRESPGGRTSPKEQARPTICALPATPLAPGSLGVTVTLAQGQEATEDAEYTARIRSNGRSAKLSILFTCPNSVMADHLRKVLKYGAPVSGGSCTVAFCLRYAENHEQIVMKTRGQTPNWVSLMAPGDNVKNATKYTQSSFQLGSESPRSSDLDTMPTWSHCEVAEAASADDCTVRADVMIVTNITSFVHDYRHFEWRVELAYTPQAEGEPLHAAGFSGPLEYYAKPKTSAELQAMQTHKLERLAEKERRKAQRPGASLQVQVPVFSPRGAVAESPRDAGTTLLARTTPREHGSKELLLAGVKEKEGLKENVGVRGAPLFAAKREGGREETPAAAVSVASPLASLLASRSPVKPLNMALVQGAR